MMLICDVCKEKITRKEADNDEVNYIFGMAVHKRCDDKIFEQNDKNIRIIKSKEK